MQLTSLRFLTDEGVSVNAAAFALGLIGLCNVVGAYLFGALGDRFSKKNLLTIIYVSRAVLMSLVLVLPMNDVSALLFWDRYGTVVARNGTVDQRHCRSGVWKLDTFRCCLVWSS